MFPRRFAVVGLVLFIVVKSSTKTTCVTKTQCNKSIHDTRVAFSKYILEVYNSGIPTDQNFTSTVKRLYEDLLFVLNDESECLQLLPHKSMQELSMELQQRCQPKHNQIPPAEPKALEDFSGGFQGMGGGLIDKFYCSFWVPYLNKYCRYVEDRIEAIRLCDVDLVFDKFYRQPVLRCANS